MVEIKVAGMTCGGCVRSISNALKSHDEKAEINVDLNTQTVSINSVMTIDEISKTITEAGFSVLSTK